jgi:DASH complex subunit DAD1
MGRPDAQETEGNAPGQGQEETGGSHAPGHSPSHSQDMSYEEEDTVTK